MKPYLIACVAAGELIALDPACASPIAGFSISGGSVDFLSTPSFTLGYAFTTTSSVRVSELGVFDYKGDGLAESHAVGLFDSVGHVVARTTLASGSAGTLSDGFRYSAVATTTLLANQTYYIGALYNSNADEYLVNPGITSGASSLTYLFGTFGAAENNDPFLAAPLTEAVDRFDGSAIAYFGPNLVVSAVPLPAGLPLFALGLLGLVGAGMRRGWTPASHRDRTGAR